MLVAEDDGRKVGCAHTGPRGALSIALAAEACGQGLGRRLAATWRMQPPSSGCARSTWAA
jgi:hypothetical protein